nr:immunoglobulin heavy chain junction region [Macaca mulatta]
CARVGSWSVNLLDVW